MEWNEGSKKPSDLFLPHDEQGRVARWSQTAAVQLGAGLDSGVRVVEWV